MKNFGWKKIRKFPARRNGENVMRFALEFKRKFPNFDIIKFFQKEYGQESTSEIRKKRNCPSFIIVHEDMEIPEGEAEWISHFAVEECNKHKEWHKDKEDKE